MRFQHECGGSTVRAAAARARVSEALPYLVVDLGQAVRQVAYNP